MSTIDSPATLTAAVEAWKSTGRYEDVDGHLIFVHRSRGDGPLVVLLHGYPASSYDWREVMPALEKAGVPVLAFDFLGFGLSDKPRDVLYSLKTQADIVERLVDGRPAIIIAHDMGDSVACELMARDINHTLGFNLDRVMMMNGSVIIGKADLTVAQRLLRSRVGPLVARVISERIFRKQLAGTFSREHPLTDQEAADQWSLMAYNRGHAIIDKLSYLYRERVLLADRWEGAIRNWRGRLDLAWASQDHICGEPVLHAIIELRPSATVTRWPHLGHFPQIEDAATVTHAVMKFVRG